MKHHVTTYDELVTLLRAVRDEDGLVTLQLQEKIDTAIEQAKERRKS